MSPACASSVDQRGKLPEMLITLPMAQVLCWSCTTCIDQRNHTKRVKELYSKETIQRSHPLSSSLANSLSPVPYIESGQFVSEHLSCQTVRSTEDMCLVCQRVSTGSTEMPVLAPGPFSDGYIHSNGVRITSIDCCHFLEI